MGCCFAGSTSQAELAASISFHEARNTTNVEKKPMSDWHKGQVLEWLDNNNNKDLKQLKPVFHQHQISGLTLETITKEQLKNELNINQDALCDLFLVEREKYINTKSNDHKQTIVRNSQSQSISKSIDIKILQPATQIRQSIINITNLYNILNQFNMNSIKIKIIDLRANNLFNDKHILTSVNINQNTANNEINNVEDLSIIDTTDKVEFYKHLQSFKSETKLIVISDENDQENKIFKTNLQNYLYKIYGIHEYILLENAFDNFYEKYPFLCHCNEADMKKSEEKIEIRYPTEIIENKLYICDWKQSESFEILNDLNITHILNVSEGKHQVNKINVFYKHIPIKDNMEENILDGKLQNAIKWIDDYLHDENRILVHCVEGISPSATIIIGYLMNENKWNFSVALRYLKNIRPSICPNDGFKKQLVQFQKQIIE